MASRPSASGQPPRKRFCTSGSGGHAKDLFDQNFLSRAETLSRTGSNTNSSPERNTNSSPERESTSESSEEEEQRIRFLVKRLLSEEVAGMNRIRAPPPLPCNATTETAVAKEGTWKEAWRRKCEARLPFLKNIFTAGAVEEVLVGAVMTVLPESSTSSNNVLLNVASHASKWYAAIKFSKHPGKPKSVWISSEGKAQSHFRNVVVRNIIRNVHENGAEILRKVLNETPSTMLLEDEFPTIPEWMQEGFLTATDVGVVLKRKEGSNGSKGRRLRTKKLQNVDVARYAIEQLYTQLTKVLISSRRRVDETFFGRLGYVFVDWTRTPVKNRGTETIVDQNTLEISFPRTIEATLKSDAYTKVPEAAVCTEEVSLEVTNQKNISEYAKLKLLFGGLFVDIEHEVLVRCPGGWRKDRIRRRIHFLELAEQMIITYSYGIDAARVYRSHRDSFKKIAALAVLLCAIVQRAEGVRKESEEGTVLDLSIITVGSACLSQFMPCDYRIREVIRKGGCLTCSESQTIQ